MKALLAWLAVSFAAAGVGAVASQDAGAFYEQLALNALWTWLFFAWRLGAAAFAEILLLWLLIAATLVAFWRVRQLAALLG